VRDSRAAASNPPLTATAQTAANTFVRKCIGFNRGSLLIRDLPAFLGRLIR
jgi:hypothetical protein